VSEYSFENRRAPQRDANQTGATTKFVHFRRERSWTGNFLPARRAWVVSRAWQRWNSDTAKRRGRCKKAGRATGCLTWTQKRTVIVC